MRVNFLHRLAIGTLGAFVLILSGCASSPTPTFYQLSPMSGQPPARAASQENGTLVAIGPIRIPDYLDRPQIVTRSGKNDLKLAEFNRWAGSIDNDVVRVLVEDVSAQLPPDRFFVIRWSPLLDSQVSPSYRVEILVNRFEGAIDGPVTLKTQWGIFGKARKLLFIKESVIVEQVNGSGYGAYVEAMSRALERLSKEIADGIVSCSAEENKETKALGSQVQ